MRYFKIDSHQLSKDKTELSLFIGGRLYCTIKHKDKGHKIDEFEVLCIIDGIEFEHNIIKNKSWFEYLAK